METNTLKICSKKDCWHNIVICKDCGGKNECLCYKKDTEVYSKLNYILSIMTKQQLIDLWNKANGKN